MIPAPRTIGLPPKFDQWRACQDIAIHQILTTAERFLTQVVPTGGGKSAIYTGAAMLTPGRTIILTSTKGLQTQLIADFADCGAVEMRGKGNYRCRLNSLVACDACLCNFGVNCTMREEGGCPYYDALRRARKAKIVITNYAYWMAQNEFSDGLGKFERMVLDEAHDAPNHLTSHVSVQFSAHDTWEWKYLRLADCAPANADDWQDWAEHKIVSVESRLAQAKLDQDAKKFAQLSGLKSRLERLTTIDNTWVWEGGKDGITLSPAAPGRFAEAYLFVGVPRVLLTSATIVPKTGELLGIRSGEHTEYPHMFPVENRRLIHIPTVRVNHKNGAAEEARLLARVDQIIGERMGEKGIIHTISYKRRDMILAKSRYAHLMVTHNRRDTEAVVRAFKQSNPPNILVSPSMATGWDFPADELRWQIILKLPYPDIRGAITQERTRADPDYTAYLTMQQLIQACGRGVRSEDDWCDTFIIDNNIVWFLKNYKHLMVDWFGDAFVKMDRIPERRSDGS